MHKFGIFVIDDMIEFLGVELIKDIWPDLCEALLKFAARLFNRAGSACSLGGLLGALGDLLGVSWKLVGALEGLLEIFWGLLGISLALPESCV